MADNAYEVLKSEHPNLIEVLDTNHDVCDFLMSFYRHIENIASESPNDPKDLMCTVDVVMERLLRIQTRYYDSSQKNKTANSKLPRHRNINIVSLFQVNHNIRDVALRVLQVVERWLKEKPERAQQGFKNIRIENAKLWPGEKTFTAELVMFFEFQDFVSAKLKFDDMDAPEQLTEEDMKAIEENEKVGEVLAGANLEWRKK